MQTSNAFFSKVKNVGNPLFAVHYSVLENLLQVSLTLISNFAVYSHRFIFLICYSLRGTDLTVNVSTKFQCMLGNKTRQLRLEVSPEIELAAFKKDNNSNGIVYLFPTNHAAFPHHSRAIKA